MNHHWSLQKMYNFHEMPRRICLGRMKGSKRLGDELMRILQFPKHDAHLDSSKPCMPGE